MRRLILVLCAVGLVAVGVLAAQTASTTVAFPAKNLNPTGATKADRRCWGSVTVSDAGTYRVLVEFPDKTLHEVAKVAFAPAKHHKGVLRVRAYADDVPPEPPEIMEVPK